jgi:hypothetical protein
MAQVTTAILYMLLFSVLPPERNSESRSLTATVGSRAVGVIALSSRTQGYDWLILVGWSCHYYSRGNPRLVTPSIINIGDDSLVLVNLLKR